MSLLVELMKRCGPSRRLIHAAARPRAREIIGRLEPFIEPGERLLDIGAGLCVIAGLLRERHYDVTPLDVCDVSYTEGVTPIVYDGRRMPFPDGAYDTSLLVTVLHHTPDPERVVREAMRVTRRGIVIIEDIYSNLVGRYATCLVDSLINLEFLGHPHANRCDRGWRQLFDDLGLDLVAASYSSSFFKLRHATYYLEKRDCGIGRIAG